VIPPDALEALNDIPRFVHCPLTFHSKTGKPLNKESHWRAWDKVRNVYGLPAFTWHELRRTATTIFRDRGASDRDIQRQMGWRSSRMLDHYDEPNQAAAIERLARVFRRPTPLRRIEGGGATGESQGE
jgi:integrase